jgi:hypothetical protein
VRPNWTHEFRQNVSLVWRALLPETQAHRLSEMRQAVQVSTCSRRMALPALSLTRHDNRVVPGMRCPERLSMEDLVLGRGRDDLRWVRGVHLYRGDSETWSHPIQRPTAATREGAYLITGR